MRLVAANALSILDSWGRGNITCIVPPGYAYGNENVQTQINAEYKMEHWA